MKRRDFVTAVSLGLAAGLPAISTPSLVDAGCDSESPVKTGAALPPAARLEYASALGAAEAIRKKQISSVELTQQLGCVCEGGGRRGGNKGVSSCRSKDRARTQ
jgi:hypothetical protein